MRPRIPSQGAPGDVKTTSVPSRADSSGDPRGASPLDIAPTIRGTLAETPLARLIGDIHKHRLTGTLTLLPGPEEFEDTRIVFTDGLVLAGQLPFDCDDLSTGVLALLGCQNAFLFHQDVDFTNPELVVYGVVDPADLVGEEEGGEAGGGGDLRVIDPSDEPLVIHDDGGRRASAAPSVAPAPAAPMTPLPVAPAPAAPMTPLPVEPAPAAPMTPLPMEPAPEMPMSPPPEEPPPPQARPATVPPPARGEARATPAPSELDLSVPDVLQLASDGPKEPSVPSPPPIAAGKSSYYDDLVAEDPSVEALVDQGESGLELDLVAGADPHDPPSIETVSSVSRELRAGDARAARIGYDDALEYMEVGDFDQAIRRLGAVLRIAPDVAIYQVTFAKALLFKDKGKNVPTDRVIGALEEALRVDPRNADAHHLMGRALAPNDARGARNHLKRALELDPSHTGAKRDLVRLDQPSGSLGWLLGGRGGRK